MTADLQRHPLSAALGDMPAGEFAELVADIKRNGLLQAVVTIRDDAGTELVLDGWHRYRACVAAGVKPRTEPFDYVVEPAGEEAGRTMSPAEFVIAQNAHRRHLTREQRRKIVAELLQAAPEASDRAIAAQAKVDHKTVGAVRRDLVATGEVPQLSTATGRDGKSRPKPAPKAAPAIARVLVHPVEQAEPVMVQVMPMATRSRDTLRVSMQALMAWTRSAESILDRIEGLTPFAANRAELPPFVEVPAGELDAIGERLSALRRALSEGALHD